MMYTLAKQIRGEEMWFTGKFVDSGPQMTSKYSKAMKFQSAASAYAYAGMNPHLRLHRAVPPVAQRGDGFRTRWWLK